MAQDPNTRGAILPQEERRRVVKLVASVGERRAVEVLGISRHTLARCIGALTVHRGTAAQVREALRSAEGSQ